MHVYPSISKKVFLLPDSRMFLRHAAIEAVRYLPDPLKNDNHSIKPILVPGSSFAPPTTLKI